MIGRVFRFPIVVAMAVLALATPGTAAPLEQLMQDFRVTSAGLKPAPAFTAKTLAGPPTTLAAHRGRAVLLYFWATW